MRSEKKNFSMAFTLIEMLVTVTIILLLVGMLLPAIRGARMRGRDALCKNNLKQLQVAAMTYAISEGNGSLPHAKSFETYDATRPAPRWRKFRTGWLDWVNYATHNDDHRKPEPGETPWWGPHGLTCITNGTLWKYVKSTKAYSCPEWAVEDVCGKFDPMGVILTFNKTNNVPWRCYVMSYAVSGANIGDIEASKRLLFTEAGSTNFLGTTQIARDHLGTKYRDDQLTNKDIKDEAYAWDGSFSVTPVAGQNYPEENVGLYHSGKANAVFADGHIEKLDWNVTTNAASGNW